MIRNMIVADAVVHPYDLAPSNQIRAGTQQLEAVYAAHRMAVDARHQDFVLQHSEFFSDFSFEAMAQAEFVESPVDLAVIRALPGLGFAKQHVTSPQRAAAFRDRYPDRFKLYATVDTPVLTEAIAQLEQQVKDLGVDGLKLYLAFFYDGIGQGWRLDGDAFATPLLEAAIEMGIKHVCAEEFGLVPLTEQGRRNILGLNCLRMHGVDAVELARRVGRDEFSQARAQGIPGPWSELRGTALTPSA
jgi:predicted TIM-barrel fold metal-dependent hydrolase